MGEKGRALAATALGAALGAGLLLSACGKGDQQQEGAQKAPAAGKAATPSSIPMGGAKSVTRFFITSKGLGKGGDLGTGWGGRPLPDARRGPGLR